MNLCLFGLFLLCAIFYSSATNVTQCTNNTKPMDNLDERVKVGNCQKPPCRLRRTSVIHIVLKITPEKEVKKLTNAIYVHFAGVPVAFDENDACDLIYTADGKDKAGCPLKAGQDYIYKNDMNVFDFFPKVKGVVHFAVTGDDGDDVICFEVPAIITN